VTVKLKNKIKMPYCYSGRNVSMLYHQKAKAKTWGKILDANHICFGERIKVDKQS
jgi:predicted glycosyltransferase involved in capsule biosynthesis